MDPLPFAKSPHAYYYIQPPQLREIEIFVPNLWIRSLLLRSRRISPRPHRAGWYLWVQGPQSVARGLKPFCKRQSFMQTRGPGLSGPYRARLDDEVHCITALIQDVSRVFFLLSSFLPSALLPSFLFPSFENLSFISWIKIQVHCRMVTRFHQVELLIYVSIL